MKEAIHALARTLGLRVLRLSTVDRGILIWHDIRRILGAHGKKHIFDVGANEGQTARKMQISFPEAKIFCFEPVTETVSKLRANLGNDTRLVIRSVALSDVDGWSEITNFGTSGINRLVKQGEGDNCHLQKVRTMKLDTFCAEEGVNTIDLLKTDCEGHDLQVLQGGSEMLEKGNVLAVYSEVTFLRNAVHSDFYSVDRFLSDRGLVFYGLYEYSGWQYDVSTDGFMNALFIKRSVLNEKVKSR